MLLGTRAPLVLVLAPRLQYQGAPPARPAAAAPAAAAASAHHVSLPLFSLPVISAA